MKGWRSRSGGVGGSTY